MVITHVYNLGTNITCVEGNCSECGISNNRLLNPDYNTFLETVKTLPHSQLWAGTTVPLLSNTLPNGNTETSEKAENGLPQDFPKKHEGNE